MNASTCMLDYPTAWFTWTAWRFLQNARVIDSVGDSTGQDKKVKDRSHQPFRPLIIIHRIHFPALSGAVATLRQNKTTPGSFVAFTHCEKRIKKLEVSPAEGGEWKEKRARARIHLFLIKKIAKFVLLLSSFHTFYYFTFLLGGEGSCSFSPPTPARLFIV